MRKMFCFFIIIAILISFVSCKPDNKTKAQADNHEAIVEIDTSMPEPFGEQLEGTGGDEHAQYYQPCNWLLDGITGRLLDLVDKNEYNKWRNSFGFFPEAPTSLMDYLNVFSFIMRFDISDEDFKKVIELENQFYKENDLMDLYYTDEDIEIILSRDESKIMEHFASEYSIVNNGKIYSPQWIFTHTIKAYEAEEIPPELIKEKMELYKEIPFAQDALGALEKKLNSYIAMDLKFDKVETSTESSHDETTSESSSDTTSETSSDINSETSSETTSEYSSDTNSETSSAN